MLPSIVIDSPNNIDFYFYSNDLGLRLVKLTLNQDDSSSYHLYFGDKTSRLGTILTFFHWPEIPSGSRGTCLIYLENRYIPAGSADPILPKEQGNCLLRLLQNVRSDITLKLQQDGHNLHDKDILDTKGWIENISL